MTLAAGLNLGIVDLHVIFLALAGWCSVLRSASLVAVLVTVCVAAVVVSMLRTVVMTIVAVTISVMSITQRQAVRTFVVKSNLYCGGHRFTTSVLQLFAGAGSKSTLEPRHLVAFGHVADLSANATELGNVLG
ncbi:Aste57867_6762 [Aphanomyces stellatus]|uniref:Aste57867_6762 protein n=1 Tax=Aphanomyces stellatus TaxID=120398 RepID=A0A485KHX1_9STRA|nr:hypothetical protein As57867_006742 [Aphanomyces stellatus]VFT83728.1 Aste57867_6762 [Aphanomyces stellatus]